MNIDFAFKKNEVARDILLRKYSHSPAFLTQIDMLIGNLRESDCRNIVERVKKIPVGNPQDCVRAIASFHSEVVFANHFVRSDGVVDFIPEEPNLKTPDLLCNMDGEPYLVEVTSLTEDTILDTVLGFLRLLFKVMPGLKVCIHVEFKKELSIPEVEKEKRHRQNQLVLESLGELVRLLRHEYPPKTSRTIDTEGMVFSIEPTSSGSSYPGILNSDAIEVPVENLLRRVSSDIAAKAAKQPSFRDGSENQRYVIAYDCGESLLDGADIEELLFGNRIFYDIREGEHRGNLWREWNAIVESPETHIPYWSRIDAAASDGWSGLLIGYHLIPGDNTFLIWPGAFLSCPLMDHVSAVMVRYPSGSIEGFPNPFSCQDQNLHGRIPDLLMNERIQRE